MFSVVIPYYNKSSYIIRCIDSVLRQTFNQYEIIVIDDGSTDNGIALISNKYADLIYIYSQKNQGVSVARNMGISQAKYEYVAFLDADDAWHPQYLERVDFILKNEKEVKIVGSHYSRFIDFFDKKYDVPLYFRFDNYFKGAINNTYFTSSSSVIQKAFFEENDGFNPNLKKGEDHDVWFRAIRNGGNAFYITDTLVYYSDEDSNQITKSKIALENDLVGNINALYRNLNGYNDEKSFRKFISLYVYFNLYPYFFDEKNRGTAAVVLKDIQHKFFLLKIVYLLPFSVGQKLLKSPKYSRFIRMYLKFIIRYTLK